MSEKLRPWSIGFGPVEIAPRRTVILAETTTVAIGGRVKIVDTSPKKPLGVKIVSLELGTDNPQKYAENEPLSMHGAKVIENEFLIAPLSAGECIALKLENTTDEIVTVAVTLIVRKLPQRQLEFGPVDIDPGARVPVKMTVKERLGGVVHLVDMSDPYNALWLTGWKIGGMPQIPPIANIAPVSLSCFGPDVQGNGLSIDPCEVGDEVEFEVFNPSKEKCVFRALLAEAAPLLMEEVA